EWPPEGGETYYENALAKARFGREAGAPDPWLLGEDSGLEVVALGGRPGVRSARYAPEGAPAVAKLLAELDGASERGARYVCELVCLAPDGRELRGTGTLAGRIAHEPRGEEGFGYDPIFVPDGERRTDAALGDAWKADRSHTARAARAPRGAGEQRHEAAAHHAGRDARAVQEGAVGPPVHDVERRLERAEERERRPEQPDAADDPERGRVVLHLVHERQNARERAAGERAAEL